MNNPYEPKVSTRPKLPRRVGRSGLYAVDGHWEKPLSAKLRRLIREEMRALEPYLVHAANCIRKENGES